VAILANSASERKSDSNGVTFRPVCIRDTHSLSTTCACVRKPVGTRSGFCLVYVQPYGTRILAAAAAAIDGVILLLEGCW
jgi:hypothetical protein